MLDKNLMVQELENAWNLPFVLRVDCRKASGGVFTWHILRLDEQRNQGPKERFKIGGKVAYPKEAFFAWMKSKMR